MIVYQNQASGFIEDVDDNRIVKKIESEFRTRFGRSVSPQERNSWANSLQYMERIIRNSSVPRDCGILIEYVIPATSKRIDFIITGHDEDYNQNFVIVELKQWDKADATDKDDLVKTFIGGAIRETIHPSYQAYSYKKFLTDMNEAVYEGNLRPYSCVYLHNYYKRDPEPLISSQYQQVLGDSPVFFAEDNRILQDYVSYYVGQGQGLEILYAIEKGRIRPSKKFIDYVQDIFAGNEIFTLLDEQKVAFETILAHAVDPSEKTVIVVKGGAGTGKSVVAMNALVELLKRRKHLKFVAPNAAFRYAMIEMLSRSRKQTKRRLSALFTGSSSYMDAPNDVFDVLIVDEAHRLKDGKANYYQGENQIADIVKSAWVSVFFIDDDQRVRPEDIGTAKAINKTAQQFGAETIELDLVTQFRCSGAEGYLNWLEHTLQIRDTANFEGWDEGRFELAVLDSPQEVVAAIQEKNDQGQNARVLAGFAWPWTSEKKGNPDANVLDVSMPEYDFALPWNSRKGRQTWAFDDTKVDQVGCIHTSQGLEFDYVGVLIGYDLKFDPAEMKVYGSWENYHDVAGKKGLKDNPEKLTLLIKNIYKTLMSRGMKGCFVFCRDDNLQRHLRNRLKNWGSSSGN